jgi:hypothetical protein
LILQLSVLFNPLPLGQLQKNKGGIKIHLRLRLFKQGVLPDAAIITPAKKADKTQMDELVVEEKGSFNVFDRAYLDYKSSMITVKTASFLQPLEEKCPGRSS